VKKFISGRERFLLLKRSARNFEIFSNIKLIVLKNTLRCPLYGTTNEKILSRLVCPQKITKSVIATDTLLHHMRKTQTIFSNFFEPKNFILSVYNLLIEFSWKTVFIFLFNEAKS
jgi:hypothetical protein